MRTCCLLILLFFHLPTHLFSQTEKMSCEVKIAVKNLYADRLNRVYVINQSGMFQYDDHCRLTASFTKRVAGGITSADVSNPLKILVFVQAEQKIFLLNDQLHVQSEIILSDMGINHATLVCNSRGDGFRVFDQSTNKLYRYDYNLNRMQENDLSVAFNGSFEPVMMAENEKFIAISNRGSGIMVFDRFGNYVTTCTFPSADYFSLTETEIVFFENDRLISYSPGKHTPSELMHSSKSKAAIKTNNRWIHYDSTGFSVFEE